MRHVLVHDYASIDDRELYNTAVNDIPALQKQVERYVAETNWDEWQSTPDDFEDTEDVERKTNIENARKMKFKGFNANDIAEITGLTIEEIKEL